MQKFLRLFSFAVVALLVFTACNKDAINGIFSKTHSVSFEASAPETKTSVDTSNNKAEYSWSSDDVNRFTVYEIVGENYTPATSVDAVIVDGKMLISAEFSGDARQGAQYVALFNTGVKKEQNANDTTYDQASDVLISKVVTSQDIKNEVLTLRFKRETAFARMTAKDIEGFCMIGASLTADKVVAAEYDCKNSAFVQTGSYTVSVTDSGEAISFIENNQSDIFFATVPVDDASISVAIVTADENEKFVAAYQREAKKTVSFDRGDVSLFSMAFSDKDKVSSVSLDLSKDETTTASTEELFWDRTFVKVVADKADATTNANNYYPGTSGQNYTSTRFYKGSTLTFTPKLGLSIKEIVYEATTDDYTKALVDSEWSNAIASAVGQTVTIIPTDGTKAVSAAIGATTGTKSIIIRFGIPSPISKHSINIDPSIEHGTVTADPSSEIMPGTTVTLTATPSDGYEFGSWVVKNAETEENISVVDDKFTMPNADVNVSAIFQKVGLRVVTTMSADNDADIKFVAGSSSAEGAFWANSTPLSVNDITLSGSVTSGSNYSYYDGSVVRFYMNNNIVITPSNGATIEKIEIVRQTRTGDNSGVINCRGLTASSSNTATNTNVYTGSAASAVTFTNSAQCRFTKIIVYSTPGKTVQTVTVSGDATKKNYKVGEKFETTGLVATAKFDDNSTEVVTDKVTWSVTPETLAAGTTSVSVVATYRSVSSPAFTVSGIAVATLSSISVKTAPTKVTYIEGEKFNPEGLEITRHYSDSTSEDCTYADHESEFSFAPALDANLATTDTKVTITHQGKTVDQSITVVEKQTPTFSSLAGLVGGLTPASDAVKVNVTLTKEEIIKFYKSGNYTNGVYFQVGSREVLIYSRNTPTTWEVGGLVSGTLQNCDWKDYNGTWELCPDDYTELTYTAPLVPCEIPVITISNTGSATITCATADASIYYTLGASPADPTNASTLYTGAVTMTDGQTIKAIAYKDGMKPSAVALKRYTAGGGKEQVYKTALFGAGYNSDGVQNYTSTFSATNNGFTVDLAKFNNNNNGWNFVRTGNKSSASVGTITTNAAIDKAITKVVVTIDAVTASSVNSITLYSGSSANSCTTSEGTYSIATGAQTVTISSPAANKFYKISFDCKKGSSNGLVTVSKVEYYSVY